MNKVRKIFLFLAVAALFTGCFKKVSNKTDYILKPRVQQSQGDVVAPLSDLQCYAYDADTALWTVASYEDALAGVISSRTSSDKQTVPYAVGEPEQMDSIGTVLKMSLDGPRFMIVAIDTKDRLYAYTGQTLAPNLLALYVSLTFRPFQEKSNYIENGWKFFNDFYVAPTVLNCYVEPQIQSEEGGEPQTPTGKITVYAFLADTTAWQITSYDDARGHIITSKNNPTQQRTQYDFMASEQSDAELTGLYGMEVSSSDASVTLLIVAVDTDDRLYAYSQQSIDDMKGAPVYFPPVVFRPWQTGIRLTEEEGGWRVVDDYYASESPEPANNR